MKPLQGTPEFFWWHVDRRPGECWEWRGHRTKQGYGSSGVGKGWGGGSGSRPAHRVAWELTNGPIPPGLFVCHRCDNPPCCNPAHLFVGTAADNARDREAKGRSRPVAGSNCNWAKLSEASASVIKAAPPWVKHTSVAKYFGVSEATVRRIRQGKIWRHLGVENVGITAAVASP